MYLPLELARVTRIISNEDGWTRAACVLDNIEYIRDFDDNEIHVEPGMEVTIEMSDDEIEASTCRRDV
jgi:hypothetical protein